MKLISRRAALCGIAAVPAMALPVAAVPLSNVDLAERVHDLAEQTSEAFGAWSALLGGSWELRIRAPRDPRPITFSNLKATQRSPAARVAEAKVELAAALRSLYPDSVEWCVLECPDSAHAVGMHLIKGRTEVRA